MALSIEQVAARVESLRYRAADRDARNLDVLAVRKGQISTVYPDFFPDGVDANVVGYCGARPFRGYGTTTSGQLQRGEFGF